MRCKHCGAPTRVLATRTKADGFLLERRRQCEEVPEHRFSTYEVDDGLKKTIHKHAASAARMAAVRKMVALEARNRLIMLELRMRKPLAEVAKRYNLSPTMVCTVARRSNYSIRYRRDIQPRV